MGPIFPISPLNGHSGTQYSRELPQINRKFSQQERAKSSKHAHSSTDTGPAGGNPELGSDPPPPWFLLGGRGPSRELGLGPGDAEQETRRRGEEREREKGCALVWKGVGTKTGVKWFLSVPRARGVRPPRTLPNRRPRGAGPAQVGPRAHLHWLWSFGCPLPEMPRARGARGVFLSRKRFEEAKRR